MCPGTTMGVGAGLGAASGFAAVTGATAVELISMTSAATTAAMTMGEMLLVNLGVGIASQMASMYGQQQAAQANIDYQMKMAQVQQEQYMREYDRSIKLGMSQLDYQNKVIEQQTALVMQNAAMSNQAFIGESAMVNQRMVEEENAANQEAFNIAVASKEKQGEILASSEMAGLSLDYLLADIQRQEARYIDATNTNLEFTNNALSDQKLSLRTQAENKANSYQVSNPSWRNISFPNQPTPVFQQPVGVNWGGIVGTVANVGLQAFNGLAIPTKGADGSYRFSL